MKKHIITKEQINDKKEYIGTVAFGNLVAPFKETESK